MAEWVHCNICIVRYKSAIKFYITSCGHIVCQDCLVKTGVNNHCPKCKSEAEFVTISENMESNVEAFLRPVSEFTNKLTQIVSFQQTHATSFIKGLFNKYNMAKVEVVKGRVLIKQLRAENAKLTTENAKLTTENAKLTTENASMSQQLLKEMNKLQFSSATSKFDITNSRSTNSSMLKRNLPPYHFGGPLTHPKPVLWGGLMQRRAPMNLSNRSQDISYNSSSIKSDGSSLQTSRPGLPILPMVHLNLGQNSKPNFRC